MLEKFIPCLVLLAAFGAGVASADEVKDSGVLRVTIDQAKIAKVPAGTATLVIGNPMIADVTMLKGGVGMVVTGKGFGETNLIAIDADGNILDEKQLRVEPGNSVLVVQRGDSRASYSCNPVCMPTVQLGDDDKVFGDAGGQIQARNGYASPGGPAKP